MNRSQEDRICEAQRVIHSLEDFRKHMLPDQEEGEGVDFSFAFQPPHRAPETY
jgi:hypothetical protein